MPSYSALIIERQTPVGKVSGRGRKKGNGSNIKLLNSLAVGDSVWDVPLAKMNSLRTSAARNGFSIKVRQIPETNLYAIERI